MREMDNIVVNEVTKEEVEVMELVEDMDKSFSVIVANQVIFQETSRTPQWHASIANPLTV